VTIFWSSVSVEKGPIPSTAAQIATPEAIRAAGAAPRSRKRQAATMINGKTRYSTRKRFWKSTYVTNPMPNKRAVNSAGLGQQNSRDDRLGRRLSRNSATTRTPIASPAHHTAQVGQKSRPGIAPDKSSTEVPMVALIVITQRAAIRMRAMASRRRSSSSRKSTHLSSSAATNGASVLPAAITAAPTGDGPIGRLTAKAAMPIAGQARRPRTSNATSAIPVEGQIGVTWPRTSARFRLSFAASQ